MVETDMGIAGGLHEGRYGIHGAFIGLAFEPVPVGAPDEPFPGRILQVGHLRVVPAAGFRKDFKVGRVDDDIEILRLGKLDEDGILYETDVIAAHFQEIDTGTDRSFRDNDQMVIHIFPETVPGQGAEGRRREIILLGALDDELVVIDDGGEFAERADLIDQDGGSGGPFSRGGAAG